MQHLSRKSVLLSMLVVLLAVGAVWALGGGVHAQAEGAKPCGEGKAGGCEVKAVAVEAKACGEGKACGEAKACGEGKACGAAAVECRKVIAEVEALVNEAHKAAVAGDSATAATHLAKAQHALAGLKAQMKSCPMGTPGKQVTAGAAVNAACPIMGGRINPERVKPELTRQYKGQTIAFCCGGCPEQWDKLSDAEKQAKLGQPKAPAAHRPAHH